MKVRFLQDYQGQYTGVHFYRQDQEYDLDDAVAEALIGDKRAALVAPPTPTPAPKVTQPVPKPAPKQDRGTGAL